MKAHFAAMANDPVLRRKREAKELRGRFEIGFVESEHLRRVMSLLRQVSDRQRIKPEDVAWLSANYELGGGFCHHTFRSCANDALSEGWDRPLGSYRADESHSFN